MAKQGGLLDLPTEILQHILIILSTPSFVQLTISCKALFTLAASSRNVVLHHLHSVPGIKLGLDDPTVVTTDLFLLFRQRASKHLYGANFNADSLELRTRNTSIDTSASCIDRAYSEAGRMSLVMKDSQIVRLYDNACSLTEAIANPFCGGKATILHVVHESTNVAVLYQWEPDTKQRLPPWIDEPLVKEHPYKKPNDLAVTSPLFPELDASLSEEATEPPKKETPKLYHLQFFSTSSLDRIKTVTIPRHGHLVPRHLAINSRLLWAILWDTENSKLPSGGCEIVQYTTDKFTPSAQLDMSLDSQFVDSRVVWPTDFDPRPPAPSLEDVDTGFVAKKPSQIAFFKEGRRLSLFAAGDVNPFKVIGMGHSRESRSPTNCIYFENRTIFQVNTSFFGLHESWWDSDELQHVCRVSHLCLGVGDVGVGSGTCKVLCVLLSTSKVDHDDCPHSVELNRMNHVTAENCKAVARLWGWKDMSTTLTGLDTVAVSHRGTRIAIAQWNRVLVWSLDPKMLCEDILDFNMEERTKSLKNKTLTRTGSTAEGFYDRTSDEVMGWKMACLKPVIIDLDGAVARKMSWTIQCENDDDDSDEDTSLEGDVTSDQNVNSEAAQHQHVDNKIDAETAYSSTIANNLDMKVPTADTLPDTAVAKEHVSANGTESRYILMESAISHADNKQQQAAGNEPSFSTTTSRTCVKRTVQPPTTTQSSRTIVQEKQCPPVKMEAEIDTKSDSMTDNCQSAKSDTVSLGPVKMADPDQVVVEALPPSLSARSGRGPKGKEKQIEIESHDPTKPSLLSREKRLPTPKHGKDGREKRFSEDELVILTDRGFQVWNFGASSKGIRKKRWLDEQQPFI